MKMCMMWGFTFPKARNGVFHKSVVLSHRCVPLGQSTERNLVSKAPRKHLGLEDSTTKCSHQDLNIQRNFSTTMAIGFIHASVRLVLGLLAVALSANAIEDRLSIPTNGACIDKHESKRDCLEWAWYGEW